MSAQYRITCTTQEPVTKPLHEAHIVGVGTGTSPGRYTRSWTLAEVLQAMKTDVFYTVSPSTGKVAIVRRWECSHCGRTTLKTDPDSEKDNNLDNLPRCG